MSQLWRAASRRESRGPGTERLWKPSEFTVIGLAVAELRVAPRPINGVDFG
jgi:hypothetical protein